MLNSQHVVLVDEQDNIIGTEDKLTAHNSSTHLHRGFSVFLFNSNKQLIIQQRSANKKTWPLFWSNSFCGHPQINETYEQGVHRHGKFELGVCLQSLYFISQYRYKFTMNNKYFKNHNIQNKYSEKYTKKIFQDNNFLNQVSTIVENEICPIYLAISNDPIIVNKDEIEEIRLFEWYDVIPYIKQHAENFTPWSKEEIYLLEKSSIFKEFIDLTL